MATEKELRDATEIAQLNLHEGFQHLIKLGETPPFIISDIFLYDTYFGYRNDNSSNQSGSYGW